MKASIFFIIVAMLVVNGNANPSQFHCSRYCKENWNKFGYKLGYSYLYNYNGIVRTMVNASTSNGINDENRLLFKTEVELSMLSSCDYVMRLSNAHLEEMYVNKNAVINNTPKRSKELELSLTKNALYFSFQNGRIDTICPEKEDRHILPIKKAILSAFQNSMPNLEDDAVVYESDISGNCETRYQIEDSTSKLIIEKSKNLDACSRRKNHHLSWLSVPYYKNHGKNSNSLLRSKQTCKQQFSTDFILESSDCYEEHLFQPFSNGDNGAATYLFQKLEFVLKNKIPERVEVPKDFYYDNLLSNNDDDDDETEFGGVCAISKLLEVLEKRTEDGVEPDVPRLFSLLVDKMQNLHHDTIINIFHYADNFRQQKFMLDALHLITTVNGVKAMKQLYNDGGVSEYQMSSWLSSLAFPKTISLPIIEEITPLMLITNAIIRQKAVLSASSMVHIYCKQDSRCFEKSEIQKIIEIIQEPISSNCAPNSPTNSNEVLLALKGIGNIGFTGSLDCLRNCYLNSAAPVELRLAAIAAHRRINCAENDNLEQLEDMFVDVHENTEIRIASYLASMQCASYSTFARVKDVLRKEETNQVGSFIWTHLTNLQESASQWKNGLKNLIQNEFFRNKFSTDMRKYSRNYEVSTYFDSLNTGATVESNVVFTSESYLPKSAMLNFTLDLFGEAVNIFEIGGRIEGFEQIVENLFGPNGYFPEESIRNVLESARNKDNEPVDKIQELRNSFAAQANIKEPHGLLYAKIFGNEISYNHFKSIQGIMGNQIDGRTILDTLMKLFRQQDIDYTNSFVFLDSTYKVPTLLGFPLELAVNGTAIIGLTIKSKIDLKDLWSHKIAVEGKLHPSVAVEIIGTMTVDSFVSKTGLRSVNTLNSNTYLDGHIFIDKGKLVDLKLNVPKQQMDIINVESQGFIIQSDRTYPIDDVTENVENIEGCTEKTFDTITGLKLCHGLRYVNASLSPNTPYFPLTGRFKYSINIQKTDSFDSYQLKFKIGTQMKNYRPIYAMSFIFDTPNSTVDRKLETAYILDCDDLSLKAKILSPFLKLEIDSKIGDQSDNLEFLLQTKFNDSLIFLAKMLLKSKKVLMGWEYEPFAELNYKDRKIAALSGNVYYLEGYKYSANLTLEGVSREPVMIHGTLDTASKNFTLISEIKSRDLKGRIEAVVIKNPESISVTAESTYDYKSYKNKILRFELNQNSVRRESLFEENLLLSVVSTQNHLYDTELSFNIKRDHLYLEMKSLAAFLGVTWESHQLFKFFKSSEKTDMGIKCSLLCVQKNIDYDVHLMHFKSFDKFQVYGILQLDKIQRLEAGLQYNNVNGENQTLSILLYYPKEAWYINGALDKKTENDISISLETFYETANTRSSILMLTGEYSNSTLGVHQNHTLTAKIEFPKVHGRLQAPWIIYSAVQISPDLFRTTSQFTVESNFYMFHLTFTPTSISSAIKMNTKELLMINAFHNPTELSLTFRINIYQHFEVFVNMLMPYKKLQFMLFWDKDNDQNQKIVLSVDQHAEKGLYLIDLEYPNQKVGASLVLLPAQVTVNVTWGIDSSQRIYLKIGNKVFDIGGIWFATLETPFFYIEKQEFKMSYYVLPETAELKIDVAWRDQNINVILSGIKSSYHLSGYIDVNTTIPEISKFAMSVSHIHNNTNGVLRIKSDGVIVFNHHQITGQCIWESEGTNISSNFQVVSSSNTISPVTGMLIVNNNQSTNYLCSNVNWRGRTISVDYQFENSQSYIQIKTPFKGLEVTDLNYTLIGEANRLVLEVKANVLNQFNYALVSWNNHESVNSVKIQVTSPMVGSYQVMFEHGTVFGHLQEYLIIKQSDNNIFAVQLHGDLIPLLSINITAAVKFLEHQASITINNSPSPLTSRFVAKWNDMYITSVLKIQFENEYISDLHWILKSSLLDENVNCRYFRLDNSYIIAAVFPKGYKFDNVLTTNNSSYKFFSNLLNVKTPMRSISLNYSHELAINKHSFLQEIAFKINQNESKLTLNYNINDATNFIDDASMKLLTPWQNSVTLNFSMPQIRANTWKAMLDLEYDAEKILNIESLIKLQLLHSRLQINCNLPHNNIFNVDAQYDFNKPRKTIGFILSNKHDLITLACNFDLAKSKGSFLLNVTGKYGRAEKEFLSSSLEYDLQKPLKEIYFKLLLPEQKETILFDASTIKEENGVIKGNVIVLSPFKHWEKLSLDLFVGLTKDDNYLNIRKNNKELGIKYVVDKSSEDKNIFYKGKLIFNSHFDYLENCSAEFIYEGTTKLQDLSFQVFLGDSNASFKGRYQLDSKLMQGVQRTSFDSELKLGYYKTSYDNDKVVFDVNANFEGLVAMEKSGGNVNVAFHSNIPKLNAMDVKALYEINKNRYGIKAEILSNNVLHYFIEHYVQLSLNEFEVFASFKYSPSETKTVFGKLSLLKRDNLIESQILFESPKELYNISTLTIYDSIVSSDTQISIITPIYNYAFGISNNFTLTEVNAKIYTTIGDIQRQTEFSIKTQNYYKSAELFLHIDLLILDLTPWEIKGKYDLHPDKKTFSASLFDNVENNFALIFDQEQLHIKMEVMSETLFLLSGTHQLADSTDVVVLYSIEVNNQKIKIDFSQKFEEDTQIKFEIFSTIRGLNRMGFTINAFTTAFNCQLHFQNHSFALLVNALALFNDQELLLVELNESPIVKLWSGSEKSYFSTLRQSENYSLIISYPSNPSKIYKLDVLKNGEAVVSAIVNNINTKDNFYFTTTITHSISSKYSNLTIYFYTDYKIPNEFNLTVNNGSETILGVSYSFRLVGQRYLGLINFQSQLEALQAFSLSLSLDPHFAIEFEASKEQYNINKLYKIVVALPFESKDSHLEIVLPWGDDQFSLLLLIKHFLIEFQFKSPLEEWNDIVLKANLKNVEGMIIGEITLQKNKDYAIGEWVCGYHKDNLNANVMIQNQFAEETEPGKIVINLIYVPDKDLKLVFDLKQFGSDLSIKFVANEDAILLHSEAYVTGVGRDHLILEVLVEKFQQVAASFKFNDKDMFNFIAAKGKPCGYPFIEQASVNIFQNLYYYEVHLTCERSDPSGYNVNILLDSSTDNYLFGVKVKGQIDLLKGSVIGNVMTGMEVGTSETDDYAINWEINDKNENKIIKIDVQKNKEVTYLELINRLTNENLKSNLTIGSNGRVLNLIIAGELTPQIANAKFILTTPLEALNHVELMTSLLRENNKFEFLNYLSWPNDQNLTLRLRNHDKQKQKAFELLFISPFLDPLNVHFTSTVNSSQISLNSLWSLGKKDVTFSSNIGKSYLNALFISPFSGYRFFNLTCFANWKSRTAQLRFENETSFIDFSGSVKIEDDKVYEVNMFADSSQKMFLNASKFLIKIDIEKKNGNAEFYWKTQNIQIGFNYNPKNLHLNIKSPFEIARQIRLEGKYLKDDVKSHFLKAHGVWNEIPLKFQGLLVLLSKNFTILSGFEVGEYYKGALDFYYSKIDDQREIKLKGYFPHENSRVLMVVSLNKFENVNNSSFLLSTPFDIIKTLSAETILKKGLLEANINGDILGESLLLKFKSAFDEVSPFRTSLFLIIPQIDHKWEVSVNIDLYNHADLKVFYEIGNEANSFNLLYVLVNGKFETRYVLNANDIKSNHTLQMYFKNTEDEIKYGVVLNNNIVLLFKRLLSEIEAEVKINLTPANILGLIKGDLKKQIGKSKFIVNDFYRLNCDVYGTDSSVSIEATYDFGEYYSGNYYSGVRLLKDGYFFYHNVSDYSGTWQNETASYHENNNEIIVNIRVRDNLFGISKTDLYLSKSFDKILVDAPGFFNMDIQNTGDLSKIHLTHLDHSLKINFADRNVTLNIHTRLVNPNDLTVNLHSYSDRIKKQLQFSYLELNEMVFNGDLNFHCTENDTEFVLSGKLMSSNEKIVDFTGKIVTTNVTQGFADLLIFGERNHANLILNTADPYMAGVTFGSPFLPYGGITFETGASINSTSFFIFGGSGQSNLLNEGVINLESHKEYLLFQARKENKQILIKYEAPSMTALRLVEFRTKLDLQRNTIDFYEVLNIEGVFTDNIYIRSKLFTSPTHYESELKFFLPFVIADKFSAILNLPFAYADNLLFHILFDYPKMIYSTRIWYEKTEDSLQLLANYEYPGSRKRVADIHALIQPTPQISITLNLPFENYSNYSLYLEGPNDLKTDKDYVCSLTLSDERRIEVKYKILYKRDRQLLRVIATTPFEEYDRFSLNLLHQNDLENDKRKALKALIFFPGLQRAQGFDFQLAYNNFKNMEIKTEISLPIEIYGFSYGKFVVLHRSNEMNVLHYFLQINDFSSWVNLRTAISSDLIVFTSNANLGDNQFVCNLKYDGNIFDKLDFFFELETPIEIIKNLKLIWKSRFNSIHAGFIYNTKTILESDLWLGHNQMLLKFDNILKPMLLEYEYSAINQLKVKGRVCWDLNNPKTSQFGGHIIIGKNLSVEIILPTRLMSFDIHHFVNEHNQYYFGRISWNYDKEISTKFAFTNYSGFNSVNAKTHIVLTLPFRSFEILDEVDADFRGSPTVKSKVTFSWGKNDTSKISVQNYVQHGKYESRLFLPILEHEIVLTLDISTLSKIPSCFKAQLEYSNDLQKRLEFEMHYNKELLNTFKTERKFILKHPASKIDYSLYFGTTRTPEYTIGNVTLNYTNYLLNKQEQMRSSLKIGHDRFEVLGEIETSKNYLSFSGATKSGLTFRGFNVNVQLNKKEPLIVEGLYHFKATGSSIKLISRYGDSRRYNFYAGFPSKREISVKLSHQLYDNEIEDGLFTLKLNNSQILWLKLNWKNELLPNFKSAILEEYNAARFIVEETGQHIIAIVHDDIGRNLVNDISEIQRQLISYERGEKKQLYQDLKKFIIDVNDGYKGNSFYFKDVKKILKLVFPNIDVLKASLVDPIWQFFESIYIGIYGTIDDVFKLLRSVCLDIQERIVNCMKRVKNVKKLKERAREMLKNGIHEAQESLEKMDVLVAELLDNINEYVSSFKQQCENFFEPYLKLLDDCVVYVEQRLAILQMLVLDMLDTIQHYILNLRESREVLRVYTLYVNWLEEFHVTDMLEPIGDVIEVWLDILITDVKMIMDDYKIYIDAISVALIGNYQEVENLPPLTELRETFNKIYQKTIWIWNYHNVSETIKNCIHKTISDFDYYLASLIKLDNNNDFENFLGQADYVFRPDVGVIEITQPLPVEWEAFDEMPYFEQHPLYNKIKSRIDNLVQIQRHQLNDFINIIKSYVGESTTTLLSPPTNNIGMIIGNSHYITFDKKYYSFSGECCYLLASDLITNTFSVVVNYITEEGIVKRNSIGVISDENTIEILKNFEVLLNGIEVDLPLVIGSLVVTRENSEILIGNSKGLHVQCNLNYDYCIVELSGWFFGKTGGLLGTLDNEKATDMSLPDGGKTSDVVKFARSWQVGASKCSDVNHASDTIKINPSPLSTTLFETLCQLFFINVNSPLSHCFGSVDPKPFYEMCVNNMKETVNPTMCSTAAAYKAQCSKRNVFVDMPEMCVHCNYGIDINGATFDRDNPKSIDVVFIKEYSRYDDNHNMSFFPTKINNALEKMGFQHNQFSVVEYGGAIDKPYIHISNRRIWTSAENTTINAKVNSSGSVYHKVSTMDALEYATNLQFRPGVSKLFILLQCGYSTEIGSLNKLHNIFGEKDITLHVLKFKSFSSNYDKLLEGHVLYIQDGFDIRDSNIEHMNTTINTIANNQITDVYSVLALSTNGTVLNMAHEYRREEFFQSWADIISKTAKLSPCQRCKCVINLDGTGKVECNRCISPIVKQLLNEYESNIMQFHTNQENEDYPETF